MHSVRFSMRCSFLAGTALALILAISATASAAPQDEAFQAPQPTTRNYSMPGSMPKPSRRWTTASASAARCRHRATADRSRAMRRRSRPLPSKRGASSRPSPRPAAKPVIAPEAARAQAEPEPVAKRRAARRSRSPRSRPPLRPSPSPVPSPLRCPSAPRAPSPRLLPLLRPPERATRPAAVAAAPNAASEADVGNKLREIITSKQFDRMIARKPDRDAIVALYQKGRSFQPLWVSQGAPSARAQDVLEYLRTIDADGLDPKDYPMPKLNVGSAEAQAEAELKFTEMLLTYARHAMTGRVHFSRVSPNIEYKLAFDADDVLKKIAASNDLPTTLETFNPPQPAYQALKAKLAELRDETAESEPARIGNGPVLRYTRDSKGQRNRDGRCPRAAAARAARPAGRAQLQLQRRARHGGRQVPEGQQHPGHRPVERPDHRGAEPAEPRQAARRRARHHGALALDAARPRQDPRHAQHPGLSICASTTTARRSGRPASWSASRATRRRC